MTRIESDEKFLWKPNKYYDNEISGRYPEKGYCSNLECEELCHILEGNGIIYKRDNELFRFKKGDIIFIHRKEIYY